MNPSWQARLNGGRMIMQNDTRHRVGVRTWRGAIPGILTFALVALIALPGQVLTQQSDGAALFPDEINTCIDVILQGKQGPDWINHYSSFSWPRLGQTLMYDVVISTLFLTEVTGMMDERRQEQVDDLCLLHRRINSFKLFDNFLQFLV